MATILAVEGMPFLAQPLQETVYISLEFGVTIALSLRPAKSGCKGVLHQENLLCGRFSFLSLSSCWSSYGCKCTSVTQQNMETCTLSS